VITERALFNLELQVRDLDTGRRGSLLTHLEGRAVPYNTWANVGGYMERFRPGAFAKSINENRKALPLMLFHGRDDLWPIGLATKWSSENDGLYGVWRLNDSPNAQRAAEMARTGELGFLSIGFTDIRSARSTWTASPGSRPAWWKRRSSRPRLTPTPRSPVCARIGGRRRVIRILA